MKKTVYQRDISVQGTERRVNGKVTVKMGTGEKVITGINHLHDDYSKTIQTHTIVATVDREVFKHVDGIDSEEKVLAEAEKMIEQVTAHMGKLANEKRPETFESKMAALFPGDRPIAMRVLDPTAAQPPFKMPMISTDQNGDWRVEVE